jgi:hypothetical protein
MMYSLLFALAVPAAVPSAGAATAVQDPPVRVWLSQHQGLERGDRIRVNVRTEEDGYLVVLHADPEGRIRMIFPLDPVDDHFIRGGRDYEVRNRGDRHAITIHQSGGVGLVYAAYARDPFRFDGLVRGGHWDYTLDDAWQVREDAEGELTALVDRMTGGAAFDYDLAWYDVYDRVAYSRRYYGGFWRSHFYDPFYCDVFYCSPFYFTGRYRPGVFIGIGFGFGHGYYPYWPAYYDPFFYDPFYWDPFCWGPCFSYYPYSFRSRYIVRSRFVAFPVTVVRGGFTFKPPDRAFVPSVPVRSRPASGTPAGRSTVAAPERSSPVRAGPAAPATRSRESGGAAAPATPERRPADRAPVRVRTPSTAPDRSPPPRAQPAQPAQPERDQGSRRRLSVIEEPREDGRTERHYILRIHGGETDGRRTAPATAGGSTTTAGADRGDTRREPAGLRETTTPERVRESSSFGEGARARTFAPSVPPRDTRDAAPSLRPAERGSESGSDGRVRATTPGSLGQVFSRRETVRAAPERDRSSVRSAPISRPRATPGSVRQVRPRGRPR